MEAILYNARINGYFDPYQPDFDTSYEGQTMFIYGTGLQWKDLYTFGIQLSENGVCHYADSPEYSSLEADAFRTERTRGLWCGTLSPSAQTEYNKIFRASWKYYKVKDDDVLISQLKILADKMTDVYIPNISNEDLATGKQLWLNITNNFLIEF